MEHSPVQILTVAKVTRMSLHVMEPNYMAMFTKYYHYIW